MVTVAKYRSNILFLKVYFNACMWDTMLGLSQLCLKICLKCFWEFPKNFPYYAWTLSYYVRLC